MGGDIARPDIPGAAMERAKVRALRVICWLLVAGPLVFLALLFAAYGEHARIAAGPAVVLIVAIASLSLIRLNRAVAAARLLAYGCWTAIALMALVGGGLYTPQLAAIPLVIVLAGWMLGPRHAIALTALSVVLGLALAVMLHRGAPPPLPDLPALLVWLPRAVVMVALCVLILYIVRSYETRLDEVRSLGADLSRSIASLAAEKSQLRQIAENVPALIFHGDRELRCLFANRQFADFFHGGGIPLEGLHLREILGDAVFEAALPNLRRVLAGESVLLEGERLSKDESMRHLEISLVPERDADGAIAGFYALKRDVTERLRAERALKVSEERLRLATSGGHIGIWEWDIASNDLTWNVELKRIFGLADDADGLTMARFVAAIQPEDVQRVQNAYLTALEEHTLFDCEYRILHPDGSVHWIVARGHGDYDAAGAAKRMVGIAFDVTARRRAEEQFVKVFQASPVAISISRLRDGHYLDINEAFIALFGWTREEIIGRNAVEIGIWPNQDERNRWIAELGRTGRVKNYEVLLNTKSGQRKMALVSAERLVLDDEAYIIGLVHDITERVQAQTEIRRLNAELERRVQERTAELTAANRELESFAYSISHDLRAPLRGIDGFSHLLAEEYGERLDAQGRGYLERVRRAAQRMGGLIDDILELSRVTRQEMRRVKVDLSQIAAELLEERSRAEPAHRVRLTIAPDCVAFGDPQLLRVMMQNLIENAWKYSAKAPHPEIAFGASREGGETAYFVRDNGVGFDMKYADRLFTPFQRLHKPEEFEGTGIGLATVARIVHRHGGRVRAHAEPGKGAVFRFTLPD